jgi:hypothetical protein
MIATGVRSFIGMTAIAAVMMAALIAAKAEEIDCKSSVLAAVALANPLDRSEEPAVEIVCGEATPAAIERHAAAQGEQSKSFDGVTIQAMPTK